MKPSPKNILIVGGAGYIGTALVTQLVQNTTARIIVLDKLIFGTHALHSFLPLTDRFFFLKGDAQNADIEGIIKDNDIDALVNLAALNLPLSRQYPELAFKVNRDLAVELAKTAKALGVKYVFSSTCSNYGAKADDYAVEEDALIPTSTYAQSKVDAEVKIAEANDDSLRFRFATAYGLAAMFRTDLLLHEFIRDAYYKGQIILHGPSFYRPMCHVDDIARAIVVGLNHNAVGTFNIGNNAHNFTKQAIAEMVKEFVPKTIISTASNVIDPRNYRVNFKKAWSQLGYTTTHTPQEAIAQIVGMLEDGTFEYKDLTMKVEQ